jgi:chlorosome envelope protein I
MPKVIINGETYEAQSGEVLLDVARRNGAHIGFVCDGLGFCATCECRVLEGVEALSPQTRDEVDWLGPRLKRGYRLSCQTRVQGPDTVEVITRPELLRRQFEAIFAPAKGETSVDNASRFLTNLTQITVDHLTQAPAGLTGTLNRIGALRLLFPWQNFDRFADDTSRVVRHEEGETGGGIPPATPASVAVKEEVVATPTGVTVVEKKVEQATTTTQSVPGIVQPKPASNSVTPPTVPGAAPIPAVPLAPDDLTRIEGIGKKTASVLNAAGIHTFQQLADTSIKRLEQITSEGGLNLAQPESWPEQAKLAAAGDWGTLQTLQNKLKGGRKV